jgi:hypothetical protein
MTPTECCPPPREAFPGPCPEVVELTFLLPWGQFLELERAASAGGVTVSGLLRRLAREYLHPEAEPGAAGPFVVAGSVSVHNQADPGARSASGRNGS